MRTLVVILIGYALLGAFVWVAAFINQRRNRRAVDGARTFLWFWLAASIVDLCVGVLLAGYSFRDELAIHLVIFVLPAAAAWYRSRKSRVA